MAALKMVCAMVGSTVLAAWAGGAHAQSDIVVLPAAPAAWRIVAVDGEGRVELTGDGAAAPQPTGEQAHAGHVGITARSRGGVRDTVLFDWKDRWEAVLRFESLQPLDLRPFVRRGTLEFDLDVAELTHGAIRVKLSCAEGCEPFVNIHEQGRAWVGRGWQHVALPISCFVREGADFSRVKLPFGLVGVGSASAATAPRTCCGGCSTARSTALRRRSRC